MGAMLERAGIAAKLFEAIKIWFGALRGGLAITTIIMCGILQHHLAWLARWKSS